MNSEQSRPTDGRPERTSRIALRAMPALSWATPGTTTLHGAQLWIALPDDSRHVEPRFEHFAPDPVRGPGWEARVFIGSLLGATSPVHVHTPLNRCL